jgi:arylsulfatase A-like enzyme
MRVIFVLYDSLVRNAMECYGGKEIETPNFQRFAKRSVTFDKHFVGSLPCMPARRDMHTGRLNFLHRSWGALEPFDNSFSELLRAKGVYTHLISDHYHYWEDGGSTYHNRYSSWEFIRGQEWDKWKAMVEPPIERFRQMYHPLQQPSSDNDGRLQTMINREFMVREDQYCCPQTFEAGFQFLDQNRNADNWLLHLECFDPHEPFSAPERFKDQYPTGYTGPILDWPRYKRNEEDKLLVEELRANYAALLSMCDEYFGKLMAYMDEHAMWDDTAVILTTDHGFLLAEHEWWGKNRMPFFNELAHIPLVFYHPDNKAQAGSRRQSLTQTIDIMPTLLDLFKVNLPSFVEGKSLLPLMEEDLGIRKAGMYGMFGAGTNITDGRYTYFRYPDDMAKQDLYEYTLMPMRQKSLFPKESLAEAELVNDFKFTDGVPVLKVPAQRNLKGQPVGHKGQGGGYEDTSTTLYDLQNDPNQMNPFRDEAIEARLLELLYGLMLENEAPKEAFIRLDMPVP